MNLFQKSHFKLFLILLASPLLLFAVACSKNDAVSEASAQGETLQAAKVGYIAPDFELKNLKGKPVALKSFRGKVVLVNFWATWCDPCKWEMPSMEKLYGELNRLDFEILAISADEDGLQSVLPFEKKEKFSFPMLMDSDLAINASYGVRSIPTSLIVDRSGIITNRFYGAVDWMDPKQKNLILQMINQTS